MPSDGMPSNNSMQRTALRAAADAELAGLARPRPYLATARLTIISLAQICRDLEIPEP